MPWRHAVTGRRSRLVKESVEKVIAGENPGALARGAHKDWYRELFQPCVTAGLIRAGCAGGVSEHSGLSADVAVCAAAVGSGT